MKQIDETRMRKMLAVAVQVSGSQKAFAEQAGVPESYLSEVLRGRRDVGDRLLKWFGLERVVYYRRSDGGQL